MRLQVAFGDELLAALAALERPLACVRAHMRLQVPRLLKLFQAALEWANEQLDLALRSLYSLYVL